MELEPHQYGVLKTYQKWRHHPPTYGSLIRANLKPFGCGPYLIFASFRSRSGRVMDLLVIDNKPRSTRARRTA